MKMRTQIGVTAAVLAASLVVILGQYPKDYLKWAIGTVAVLVGYWLRQR